MFDLDNLYFMLQVLAGLQIVSTIIINVWIEVLTSEIKKLRRVIQYEQKY